MASKDTQKHIRSRWIAHGSSWAEFEDLLVGDREGLIALRQAIDDALEKGEGSLRESDSEFLAVRVVDKHPDQDKPGQSWRDRVSSFAVLCLLIFVVVCFIYGCHRLPDLFK